MTTKIISQENYEDSSEEIIRVMLFLGLSHTDLLNVVKNKNNNYEFTIDGAHGSNFASYLCGNFKISETI